jgi:hypothetical protein
MIRFGQKCLVENILMIFPSKKSQLECIRKILRTSHDDSDQESKFVDSKLSDKIRYSLPTGDSNTHIIFVIFGDHYPGKSQIVVHDNIKEDFEPNYIEGNFKIMLWKILVRIIP